MKRIRKTLPPGASQKPSTWTLSAAPRLEHDPAGGAPGKGLTAAGVAIAAPRLENDPARVAPVKGLPAPGAPMAAVTSTKSYAATSGADWENDTSAGAAANSTGNASMLAHR